MMRLSSFFNKRTEIICGALLVVLAIFLVNFVNGQKTAELNLLTGYSWDKFAGAVAADNQVLITPTGRGIVPLDGGDAQANPPINLAGPVVSVGGDLDLTIDCQGFDDGDSFSLYGGVPIVYDEWRYEPPSLKIGVENSALQVKLYDGQSGEPEDIDLVESNLPIKTISIIRRTDVIYLFANQKYAGRLKTDQLFKQEKLWFGAESHSNSWQLRALSVSGRADQIGVDKGLNFARSDKFNYGLANLAQKSGSQIKIGAAVALNPLLTDQKYRQLALDEFSIWTTENELKPQFIHPKQGIYSFQEADLLVDTAIRNQIKIHGHTLVFGEANPTWMQQAPLDQRRSVMTDHIKQTVDHFKGRVSEWDVVNEPLSDNDQDYSGDGLRKHLWYQAMGSDYIAAALQAAHAADLSAGLYINEYGLEADGQRWDAMIGLINQLQKKHVYLTGIGFESHVYEPGDEINQKVLQKHLKQLASLGLRARISEIDVHGDNSGLQAQQYSTVLAACLASPNCVAYSTWGISDKYGSTTETGVYPLQLGNDLIWNEHFKPKPAYSELVKVFKSQ